MTRKTRETREEAEDRAPLKVNECIADGGCLWERGPLFDAFWREGELALMFGPPGVGKSLLAVQIADAAGRGRGIEGFAMPRYRRTVLYVDLVLSDAQFRQRYSYRRSENRDAECYRFADSMYRGRPQSLDGFSKWLREAIAKNNFQTAVIDDLSAVKQTLDGTRETLKLMRELKQLKDETGISILVLTGSAEPRRNGLVSEADLGRQRVLADVADSVFAVGHHPKMAGHCYITQTRSRTAPPVWNDYNAPVCRITRMENRLLGFVFDARFTAKIDEETRKMICSIKALRDRGVVYREIAKELGITITKASRLYKKWSPDMESGQLADGGGQGIESTAAADERERTRIDPNSTDQLSEFRDPELEEWEEAGYEEPVWLEGASEQSAVGSGGETPSDQQPTVDVGQDAEGSNEEKWDQAAGELYKRRTIYDLERRLTDYGNEIFVEKDLDDGRPWIWYHVDNLGYVHRWVRKGLGPTGKRIGPAPYLDP